ncbi:MAG: DUF2203 domain-containing protein [Bryobacteraceae bacterium]|jgi:hypothetical protein
MVKRFTLGEAQALIPRVARLLTGAVALRAEYAEAEGAIRSYAERIMMMGGVTVDRHAARAAKARLASCAAHLKGAMEEIGSLGCQVKDLDIGLVDFPTAYRGVEACLCWKLGEPDIQFWHRADEGFAGRKTIDRDFLDHHGGE